MTTTSALLIMAIVGLMTYSMRSVIILALANRTIPPAIERALGYVGPAVLAALAVNLAAGGEGGPHLDVAQTAALVVASLAAWRSRNLIVTLVAGMVTLWVVGALF